MVLGSGALIGESRMVEKIILEKDDTPKEKEE